MNTVPLVWEGWKFQVVPSYTYTTSTVPAQYEVSKHPTETTGTHEMQNEMQE